MVAKQISYGVRKPPIPAYPGQDFSDLIRGMDPYVSDPSRLFSKFPDIEYRIHTVENGYLLMGSGIDGTLVTDDGMIIEEVSCFADQSLLDSIDISNKQSQTQHFDEIFVGFDASWRNYYHWLCYGLSKMSFAARFLSEECLIIAPNYQTLTKLQPAVFSEDVFRSSIDYAGLKKRLIYLESGLYSAKKIHYLWHSPRMPEMVAHLPPFREFFQRLKYTIPISRSFPRRILISREESSEPRLDATDTDTLRRVSAKFGFEKVILGQLDLASQCNLFRNAEMVIAPHGAGLANVLFADSKIKVLEINKFLADQTHLRPCFYIFCSVLNQRYMFLNSDIDDLSETRLTQAIETLLAIN